MSWTRARRPDQDPGQCNTNRNSTRWMLEDASDDPCRLVESIMQTCDSATVQSDSEPFVDGDLKCPGDPSSSCCCNIATYALLSACWVCQGHHSKDIDSETGIKPTYEDFFQTCTDKNAVYSVKPAIQALHLPPWSMIPPASMSGRWNFEDARVNATASDTPLNFPSTSLSSSGSASTPTITGSSMGSIPTISTIKKSSPSPGTIAAAVLGTLATLALLFVGGCFFWRWRRRRRVIRAERGTKVDLTEPDMYEAPQPIRTPQRAAKFPFPYEGVVPRFHADAQHSHNPSRSDESEPKPERRSSNPMPPNRRYTAPPVDQLVRDIARLGGTAQRHVKTRRRASITTFSHSDNSGSGSMSSRRRSGTDGAGKGKYFHLPPSAQYLAEVARYPENVDPERPWNIRQ